MYLFILWPELLNLTKAGMGIPGRGISKVLCANIWLSLTKAFALLMSDIYKKGDEIISRVEQLNGSVVMSNTWQKKYCMLPQIWESNA
jgi:hypothetical protein